MQTEIGYERPEPALTGREWTEAYNRAVRLADKEGYVRPLLEEARSKYTHRRTVPIVVSGTTFSVTIKWHEGDLADFDVERIVPNGGADGDEQGYMMEDVRDAIEDQCVELLDELVASGFDA